MKLKTTPFFAVCLVFVSCSKNHEQQTYSVSGQIFAIQKNRVNVKLGGVKVNYIDGPTFDQRLIWIAENIEKSKHINDYLMELESIRQFMGNLRPSFLEFQQREFFSLVDRFSSLAHDKIESNPTISELRNLNESAKFNYRDASTHARFDYESWLVASLFSDWLDKQKFLETTTNADGEFKFDIPTGSRGYILASTHRDISATDSEVYYWIYEVQGDITTPIHLTTSNLLDDQQILVFAHSFKNVIQYSNTKFLEEFELPSLSWFPRTKHLSIEASEVKRKISSNSEQISNLRAKIEEVRSMSEP